MSTIVISQFHKWYSNQGKLKGSATILRYNAGQYGLMFRINNVEGLRFPGFLRPTIKVIHKNLMVTNAPINSDKSAPKKYEGGNSYKVPISDRLKKEAPLSQPKIPGIIFQNKMMSDQNVFVASPENKGKAKQLRVFAFIAWIIAIAGQVFAMLNLIRNETMVWLVVAIALILVLAIVGSILWKKANRLDPAAEKDKTKFYIKSQFGAVMGVLAFLPLVIFIFNNINIDGKTKGIAGSFAVVAMLAAGISGVDSSPPSVEKYTQEINEQANIVKKLNLDNDKVYWSKAGNKYHIFENCQYIKGRQGITNGTVKDSWEQMGISKLCRLCVKKAT